MSSLEVPYEAGSDSDLTITCGKDEYKVHKAVVCPRSRFFQVACNGLFFKEGRTGVVALDGDDPMSVKLMIHYLYHSDYPRQPEAKPLLLADSQTSNFTFCVSPNGTDLTIGNTSPCRIKKTPTKNNVSLDQQPNLTVHARVYALAEKYGIEALKALAVQKFKREAVLYWGSDDFLRAIEEVYTSTVDHDRGLRDQVVAAITARPSLLDRDQMRNVVKKLDLCWDLVMHYRMSNMPLPRRGPY
ncbi:hypothetical protein NKR23_g9350 [Pleurostoma richardsiae]|uniref:BTB domain-containing protein n=1 Tax=Pleurostoma richardsiae TaxID=41990 RepID=A0AA38RHI0_9PEZI|nr:hypothetical protein NKR23_g9350 [Pleurostoma richardsiae]